MKLLIVVNIEAWAVGTLARLFKLGAPEGWNVRILSCRDMQHNPTRFAREVAFSDLVHWTNHKIFHSAQNYLNSGKHVVSLHHLEGDETDLSYLLRAKGILFHAEEYAAQVSRRIGEHNRELRVISYPVDKSFFKKGDSRLRLEERRCVKRTRPFRIGFFSSAIYESDRKGIDLLPELGKHLNEQGIDWEMIVTGQAWEKVLSQPAFCNFPIRYNVVPSYFDMPRLYDSLDVFLCLSRVEGGPMTVFEAAACGVPVVSTEVGRIPEFLDENSMYYKIPVGDAQSAAARIMDVYHGNESIRQMCVKAKDSVRSSLSVEQYQERLIAFYSAAMGIDNPPPRHGRPLSNLLQRHRWRAWDRTYWAKEQWTAGRKKEAVRVMVQALLMNPLSEGIWRVPLRKLGIWRDEC